MVGFLVFGAFVGFAMYVKAVSERDKAFAEFGAEELKSLVDVSVGPGLLLYTAAMAAVVVGVVRLWTQRSRA